MSAVTNFVHLGRHSKLYNQVYIADGPPSWFHSHTRMVKANKLPVHQSFVGSTSAAYTLILLMLLPVSYAAGYSICLLVIWI